MLKRLCSLLALAMLPNNVQAGEDAPLRIVVDAGTNTTGGKAQPCFPVRVIEVSGERTLIGDAALSALIRPHASACLGNEAVGAIIKGINEAHVAKGYMTSQAFLPPQDIKKTLVLKLTVVAGRIDKVSYQEERSDYQWFVPRMVAKSRALFRQDGKTVFLDRVDSWFEALDEDAERVTLLPASARLPLAQTVKPGDILAADALQDTLDALNRVPSHGAKADLKPGAKPATSDIIVNNVIRDTFRLYGGYDTENIQGVDKLLFGVTAERDNLVGFNETASLTWKSGLQTNQMNGSLAVPLRTVNIRVTADWSESVTRLSRTSELFTRTWTAGAGIDWTILKNKTQRIVADVTLNHREQFRAINGLELTPQRVTSLSLGMSYSHNFERGVLSGRLGAAFGLPILNADQDPRPLPPGTPRYQFFKLDGSLNASYVVPGLVSFSSSLSGQWSPHALLSDDQITIGSRATVRGYSTNAIKADSGVVMRNEMAFAVPADRLFEGDEPVTAYMRDVAQKLNPYAFLDAGFGRDNAAGLDGHRLSAGVGLRYGGRRLSFDAGYGHRLSAKGLMASSRQPQGEMFGMVRLKIF